MHCSALPSFCLCADVIQQQNFPDPQANLHLVAFNLRIIVSSKLKGLSIYIEMVLIKAVFRVHAIITNHNFFKLFKSTTIWHKFNNTYNCQKDIKNTKNVKFSGGDRNTRSNDDLFIFSLGSY